MPNNKTSKKESLSLVLQEIDFIYSLTVKKLEALHQQKINLIKYYNEAGRQNEIAKIRRSLKDN